jgi:hypothetical protein
VDCIYDVLGPTPNVQKLQNNSGHVKWEQDKQHGSRPGEMGAGKVKWEWEK